VLACTPRDNAPNTASSETTTETIEPSFVELAPTESVFATIEGTIVAYGGNDTDIIIPAQINGITVTDIDFQAFRVRGLTSVIIPENVTHIWGLAFSDNRLTNITIPDSVIHIGFGAFSNNQLTNITIGNNVELATYGLATFERPFDGGFHIYYNSIGKKAGTYVYSNGRWRLTNGIVKENNFEITENGILTAYIGANTSSIEIPIMIGEVPVTKIAYGIFFEVGLTSVAIPDSVTYIAGGAFHSNELISVTIGANVTLMYYNSMYGDEKHGGSIMYYAVGNGFDEFYNNNGRMAGRYILNNGQWSME